MERVRSMKENAQKKAKDIKATAKRVASVENMKAQMEKGVTAAKAAAGDIPGTLGKIQKKSMEMAGDKAGMVKEMAGDKAGMIKNALGKAPGKMMGGAFVEVERGRGGFGQEEDVGNGRNGEDVRGAPIRRRGRSPTLRWGGRTLTALASTRDANSHFPRLNKHGPVHAPFKRSTSAAETANPVAPAAETNTDEVAHTFSPPPPGPIFHTIFPCTLCETLSRTYPPTLSLAYLLRIFCHGMYSVSVEDTS